MKKSVVLVLMTLLFWLTPISADAQTTSVTKAQEESFSLWLDELKTVSLESKASTSKKEVQCVCLFNQFSYRDRYILLCIGIVLSYILLFVLLRLANTHFRS